MEGLGGATVSDPFRSVRASLAGARLALQASNWDAEDFTNAIQAVEHELDPAHASYFGDAATADGHLSLIVAGLEKLLKVRPATATGFNPLKQDPTLQLLPGVAEALGDLKRARTMLVPPT
jgi:hypothetical protein